MQVQMAIADPTEWCTRRWAARRLKCHERSITRAIKEGRLRAYSPQSVDGETVVMLAVADVERYAAARQVLAGRA